MDHVKISIVTSLLALVSFVGCAAPIEEPTPMDRSATAQAPTGPELPIPATPEGAQGPDATKWGAFPGWTAGQAATCSDARWQLSGADIAPGSTVLDSTTNLTWGYHDVWSFQSTANPATDAAASCVTTYGAGFRLPTQAELAVLTGAKAGCPLPGAFATVWIEPVLTSDGCTDLKSGLSITVSSPAGAAQCNPTYAPVGVHEVLCVH